MITVILSPERTTKRSVRFQENLNDAKIGPLGAVYVKQDALRRLGWKHGQQIVVTVFVQEESK